MRHASLQTHRERITAMSGAPTRGEKTAEGEVWNCPRRGDVTLALGGIIVNKNHSVVAFALTTCGTFHVATAVRGPGVVDLIERNSIDVEFAWSVNRINAAGCPETRAHDDRL